MQLHLCIVAVVPLVAMETCTPSKRVDKQTNADVIASVPYYVGKHTSPTLQYGAHYGLYGHIPAIVNQHLDVFRKWHRKGTFMDIGGRNGEAKSKVPRGYEYLILERDPPTAKAKGAFKYIACDLYNCTLPSCLADIVHCNNVLEHLLRPHKALRTMASLLKSGGILVMQTQWLFRYHATLTYGDYFRFSPRSLEYLCIQAGLNPVFTGFGESGANMTLPGTNEPVPPYYPKHPKGGKTVSGSGGSRGRTSLDTPPHPLPLKIQHATFAVCYKPRAGERVVAFEEVGAKPVAEHPRFNLRFDRPLSE